MNAQTPCHVLLTRSAAALLIAALSGCGLGAPAAKPAPSQPKAAQAAPAGQPTPLPTVTKSQVREQALALVEAAALSPDPQVRANAVEAAGLATSRLQEVVVKGLADKNPAVRSVAAMTVGRSGLGEAADLVYPLLGDPEAHVRASAIYALVKLGRDVDRSPLATMLLQDSSPWVRRHAAFLLGEMRDKSALPLLRSAAVDPFHEASRPQVKLLQLHIAEAMAKLGDEKARQSLRSALYPSQPDELEGIAVAVGMIAEFRDREGREQLAPLAKYHDRAGTPYPPEIRLAIAGALSTLGDSSQARVADEFAGAPSGPLRAQAAYVYGEAGQAPDLSHLATLLNDREEPVRIAAAAAVLRAASRR